jgi:hypothetical protein
VDLHRCHEVNATLGDETGDAILTTVGRRPQGCLPADDTAARLGGDTFGEMLKDSGRDRALAMATTVVSCAQGWTASPRGPRGHPMPSSRSWCCRAVCAAGRSTPGSSRSSRKPSRVCLGSLSYRQRYTAA